MAGNMVVDTEQMRSTAKSIMSRADSLSRLTSQANSLVNGLGSWKGQAANTYKQAFSEAKTNMDKAIPVLSNYSNYLTQTAQQYDDAEAERQADNASFDGSN